MAQIVWAESALLDLNDVAEYIALDKSSAARKLVQDIFTRVDLLEQTPKSGRVPPELKRSRYREVIVGPCRIFYRRPWIQSLSFTSCAVKECCEGIFSVNVKMRTANKLLEYDV